MRHLNVETQNATLNVKLRSDSSKRQNWEYDEDGFERRYWEVMALTAELKTDDGDFEPETEKCDSERQTENRWWL